MSGHFLSVGQLCASDEIVLIHEGRVVLHDRRYLWPVAAIASRLGYAQALLLVSSGPKNLVVADYPADQPLPPAAETASLRSLLARSEQALATVGKAWQILDWYKAHRFCGFCGRPTVPSLRHLALHCEACGHDFFPRINPCVIVLVTRGEHLLLAQNARYRSGFMSCLAGFIEAGESAEDTVLREVKEESGLSVHNIRYFRSQSWPFPSQLMLGFHADYQSGEIVPEPEEIAQANWYRWDALPPTPAPEISIAGQLIAHFVQRMQSRAV